MDGTPQARSISCSKALFSGESARGVEQGLIDHYGLDELDNKINSMSDTNPNRQARIDAGEEHVDRFLDGEKEGEEEESTCSK